MAFIELTDDEIRHVLEGVVREFLIPKFLALGMNASGKWIESLSVDVQDGKGYIKGQYYTYYLVNGRAGGSEPPLQPIINWVEDKLGKSGDEAERIAWAVKKKIGKVGTKWFPSGSDLLEVLEAPATKEYIYTQIGGLIRAKLISSIKRTNKEILTKQ